jgi:anti-sigma B factor antagonist
MSAILREGSTVTITPGQDLVSTMVPGLKQELSTVLAESPAELRLDLTGTALMDSIGIGVVIAAHNSMKKKGGKLVVANASENIIKLFKSMRLDQHLTLDS